MASEYAARSGYETILLICQSSLIDMWIGHYTTHYPEFKVFDLMVAKNLEAYMTYDGKKIGIISYQTNWRRPILTNLENYILICDESSNLQNRTAKQTKGVLKLHPGKVVLLSGTPVSGKYENLWVQAHLLGWNISETLYQRQYVNWKLIDVPGGMKVKVVDKAKPYKNIDRLKEKLREHGAVFMKSDEVLTLPEQTFIEVKVKKSKEYTRFMKDSIVSFDDVELVGDTTLTKRLYARQLCGQYNKDKLQAFADLLDSTNDRLIVFYNFNSELEKLQEIAKERPQSVVNGSKKNLEAYELYDDSITFVQYQAGSMGLNLQKANRIVYFTLPERSELFEQSKKRIHRIGQSKACFYYVMTCFGSVEQHIYAALKMRCDFTDELFRKATL